MDEELIRWCVLATGAACSRMTAPHLKALQDSVGQARSLPARFAWDRKATAHAQIFNLLADVITDRPVLGDPHSARRSRRRSRGLAPDRRARLPRLPAPARPPDRHVTGPGRDKR